MTKSILPKYTILYADDDEDDQMLVEKAFSKYSPNVEVVTAQNGEEALSYLKKLSPYDPSPCLIILDINMPRLNGKETLKKLRNIDRFRETPVVLYTTSSQTIDKNFALENNVGFFTKPIDSTQLEIITDQFIQHCADEVKKNFKRTQN